MSDLLAPMNSTCQGTLQAIKSVSYLNQNKKTLAALLASPATSVLTGTVLEQHCDTVLISPETTDESVDDLARRQYCSADV